MPERTAPHLSKWPFYIGDALLLGLAYLIYGQSERPMSVWDTFFVVVCVAFGAVVCVAPFVIQYRAWLKLTEADRLSNAVLQIQNLEIIGRQISGATANWQTVQDHSAKSIETAREIAEGITAEARAFTEFLRKANDTEKNHLRLEVEKLRRGEMEWVQILMRLLDHVYALYRGAVQSGQTDLVDQIGHFQNSCRDVARRVGLVPFVGVAGETFDPKAHQPADSSVPPSADARVGETVTTGYSFQGQLVRPALVTLWKAHPDASDLSVSKLFHRHEEARSKEVRDCEHPSDVASNSATQRSSDDAHASAEPANAGSPTPPAKPTELAPE